MKKLLGILILALFCARVQAQNVEGQLIASQYQYLVAGFAPNTYSWPGGTCNASGPQKQFAFYAGAPITIVDGNPALTENVTPTATLNNNQTCAISIAPVNNHQVPFSIKSATGGLQEALNLNIATPATNTVILNAAWYQSVGASNATAVIAAAKGTAQLNLVDVTTTPYNWYAWNGSQYVLTTIAGQSLANYNVPGLQGGGRCFVYPSQITTDAFALINSCSAQLPAQGGLIDATALGTADYPVTTQLTALNNANQAVYLLLNGGTRFLINTHFSSPTNSPASCAVPVGPASQPYGGSAIIVPGKNSFGGANFVLGPSASVQDVVCNGDFTGNQESLKLDGVYVQGNQSATMSGALLHLAGVFTPTSIINSGTLTCFGQCLELDAGTTGSGGAAIGNLLFQNDLFQDTYSGSATYPGSVVNINTLNGASEAANINFVGGMIQLNGPHNPLLTINGHGGYQADSIGFFGTTFQGAPATTSGANPNVDPIQLTDVSSVLITNLRFQGASSIATQPNLVDINGTVQNASYGINIDQITAFTGAFTCLVKNNVEGTCESGYPNGVGDTAAPNYTFGQFFPQIRQSNVAPPTTPGQCVIGDIWTNSTAISVATTFQVCAGVPGSQIYQPIGGGGGGGGSVNNGAANQLGEYPAAGGTIGPAPGFFALTPSMTQAQINTLLAGISAPVSIFIPPGTPQQTYTVGGQVPHDFRLGADWFQMPGVACDGKQSALSLAITSGSNTSFVGSLLSAADVGKTFFFFNRSGYAYGSTQSVWTAKLQSFTFPNATWSASAPFSSNTQVFYGTDNLATITAAMAQASAAFPLTIPTGCHMLVSGPIQWNSNQVIVGRHMAAGGFIGRPGADVISTVDSPGNSISQAGTGLKGFHVLPGTEVDWTLGYNLYAADGTLTVVPPVYRPIYEYPSVLAPNPLAPGSLTGGKNGVAKITQNSAVVCTPNSETPPAVGQQFMLPYHTNIFTSTVSSTSGSCSAGFTARTLGTALPNTADFTSAQDEWFTGSAIQSTTTTIPTTITYPLALTMTLSVDPVPGFTSNWPQTGTIKVCGVEMEYGGASGTTVTARRGPATSAGCTGTTPVAQVNQCRAKNLLGSGSDQPWPVTPSINAGDSTPSGANWFPGGCVGNAGIAFPTANGNTYVGAGLVGGFIEDIDFQGSAGLTSPGVSSGNANNVADIYMSGNEMMFSSRLHNLTSSNTQYCTVQGPASAGQHGVAAVGPTGIGNSIDNYWCFAGQPMAFVDMQSTAITNLNMNSAEISPFDGTAVGSSTCLQEGFTLDEQTGGVVTSTQYNSHHGYACEGENGSHAWVKPVVDIQSGHASFEAANFEAVPSFFGGDHLKITNSTLHLPAIDYGSDNDFGALDGSNSGYITNIWDATHPQFVEWGKNAQCSMFQGGTGPEQACGASLVQGYKGRDISPSVTGSKAYYPLGGMITPWMWDNNGAFDTNPFTKSGTPDPSAHTWGASSQCALGGGLLCHTNHFAQSTTGFLYMGPFNQLYDGPYVLDATFKSVSAGSTFVLTIRANDSGSGQCASGGSTTLYAGTVTTTTSYTAFNPAVDMTGHAGCILDVTYSGGSTTDTILTDRFNLVPQPLQVLLPTANPTVGAACSGPNAVIGSNSTTPLYCLNGIVAQGASSGISGGTTNQLPVYSSATTIIPSLWGDNGTTGTYTGTGGVNITSTLPGRFSLLAGTGSLPALAANSWGFAAPATGGTSILVKPPATTTQGFWFSATPATGDGVNESALSMKSVPLILDGGVGMFGGFTSSTMLKSATMPVAGHFTNLEVTNVSTATCTTAPAINVYDYTASTFGTQLLGSTTGNIAGTGTAVTDQAQTLAFSAGDRIAIAVATTGSSCASNVFTVTANISVP